MRRFNVDQFIWFCILATLSGVLGFMILSGKIFLLINSDRKISITFMIIFLIILTVVQATRIFTIPSRDGVRGGYFQFIVLIILLILVSVINITKTSLSMRGVRLTHSEHGHSELDAHSHNHFELSDELAIDDSNFHEFVEEISQHIDDNIGKTIKVSGVYYMDKKYDDSFIITQLNMNCCIADSEYLGVLCEIPSNMGSFKVGEEIEVTGKINSFKDGDKTIIKLEEIEIK